MTDYIDRNKAINALEYNNKVFHYADSGKENIVLETVDKLCQVLCETPAADVQPVKRGRWVITDDVEHFIAVCSECGRAEDSRAIKDMPYCHCGARMDGDVE